MNYKFLFVLFTFYAILFVQFSYILFFFLKMYLLINKYNLNYYYFIFFNLFTASLILNYEQVKGLTFYFCIRAPKILCTAPIKKNFLFIILRSLFIEYFIKKFNLRTFKIFPIVLLIK